jgi:hypothetical protein
MPCTQILSYLADGFGSKWNFYSFFGILRKPTFLVKILAKKKTVFNKKKFF